MANRAFSNLVKVKKTNSACIQITEALNYASLNAVEQTGFRVIKVEQAILKKLKIGFDNGNKKRSIRILVSVNVFETSSLQIAC